MDYKKFDLNLLRVLGVLLEERQVTRAAERLAMSQPAVSRALQRLRQSFDDPLLVRSVQGYDLTPRAQEILPRLKASLTDINTLMSPATFDPIKSQDLIRIGCLDLEGALFIPQILSRMRSAAPGMRLDVQAQPDNHFRALQEGDLDFVISGLTPSQGETEIKRKPLTKTRMVCLMDRKHPLASSPLTLENYVKATHGIVSMTGFGSTRMDKKLERLGLKREVKLRSSSFLTVPDYLKGTDLIFSLPEILAQRLCRDPSLVIQSLPEQLDTNEIQFYLYWHRRNHSDPKHHWIRKCWDELVERQVS